MKDLLEELATLRAQDVARQQRTPDLNARKQQVPQKEVNRFLRTLLPRR